MPRKSYRAVINEVMALDMRRDPSVIVMGEECKAEPAPPARTTSGAARWASPRGSHRVRADAGAGHHGRRLPRAAVGAAITGMRSIAELMFVDFLGACFDAIYNQAGKFRYVFGGKAETPLMVRTMYGAGLRAASQHSQVLYSLSTRVPGVKVVVPSPLCDAKGLMIQSIRDNAPVVYFEHKMYDNEAYTIPFGKQTWFAKAITSPSARWCIWPARPPTIWRATACRAR